MRALELIFHNFWSAMWAFLIVFAIMFYLNHIIQVIVYRKSRYIDNNVDEEELLGLRPGYQAPVIEAKKVLDTDLEEEKKQVLPGAEFINVVKEFRQACKLYRQTKDDKALTHCMELENEIDKHLENLA